jgi:hypothetical protein
MASTLAHARFADLAPAAGTTLASRAPADGSSAPASAANAREAVEAIGRVAEAQAAQADRGASAATLQFKFGAENLSVKVELQNGEVRTQFRTDSSELRDAIAAQWGSLAAPDAGTRPYHFAPPVFSSSGNFSQGTASGGGMSGSAGSFSQGQPFARDPESSEPAARLAFGSVKAPAGRQTGDAPADAPSPAVPGARRLLAFA